MNCGVPIPNSAVSRLCASIDRRGMFVGGEQADALAAEQFWPELIKFLDNPSAPLKQEADAGRLEHPRLAEFWTIADTILERDELVHRHLYGAHHGDGLQPERVPAESVRLTAPR